MSNAPSNHHQTWSVEDNTVLLERWARKNISVGEQQLIAKNLGRTFETCRTQVTRLRHLHGIDLREHAERTTGKTSVYIGAFDDPEDCWWK